MRAYVGLGANLGDRAATLAAAIASLGSLPGVHVAGVSRLYATRPVGPPNQPEYLNAVVALEVHSGTPASTAARAPGAARQSVAESAVALLATLKELERQFGRRPRGRWGPRELDLDLLVFGRHTIAVAEPRLIVPHPFARERLFVVAPLRDLVPTLRPPGWGETVRSAYQRQLTVEGPDAVRPIGEWDARTGGWALAPGTLRRQPIRGVRTGRW